MQYTKNRKTTKLMQFRRSRREKVNVPTRTRARLEKFQRGSFPPTSSHSRTITPTHHCRFSHERTLHDTPIDRKAGCGETHDPVVLPPTHKPHTHTPPYLEIRRRDTFVDHTYQSTLV